MKKLGFGLMRLPLTDPQDPTSVDREKTKAMFDRFIAEGFTYFDTAYFYHKGVSESIFRELVVERYPRNAFTVTDKLPIDFLHEPADVQRIYNEQKERLGVDFFDFYFMHAISRKRYDIAVEMGAVDFLKAQKEAGVIKKLGFSFHGKPEELEYILDRFTPDLVQIQLNYYDWTDGGVQAGRLHEICSSRGIQMSIMEPLRGGALADPPEPVKKVFAGMDSSMSPASFGIRFAASLPDIYVVLSGMSSLQQVEDNISYMKDFSPLTEVEIETMKGLYSVIEDSYAIKCTKCGYCVEGCPMGIAIPDYFALYNKQSTFTLRNGYISAYEKISANHGKASDCVACGQCESKCTQQLPIIDWLEKVSKVFDK